MPNRIENRMVVDSQWRWQRFEDPEDVEWGARRAPIYERQRRALREMEDMENEE